MSLGLKEAAHKVRKSLGVGYRIRGDRARDKKDWSRACQMYRLHLDAEPSDAAIWVQFGHALKENRQFAESLAAYRYAESLIPKDPDLQLNIGHLHRIRGEMDLARAAYGLSMAIAPGLFGGAAGIAIEQILARTTWREENGADSPKDLSKLVELVRLSESHDRRLFYDYFRSFELR